MNDDLEQLNRDYVRSVQDSDVRWFEQHLSQDFLNTNPDGSLVDRAGFIAQIARPAGVKNLECQDVRIRQMGEKERPLALRRRARHARLGPFKRLSAARA